MHLKRLEILGFKSFADKTKLEFDPGITAIVGPNGCGKSNIADAFRWVLGEQSAKSMRGLKMPDVIFAGTSHRKPLNFAEVTITLGDVEEELPISYEEVSVTRRLHRSGESEYFINRHPVRLKDVQGLFLDTGMGKDAYSIFEQGKIEEIINLQPLERRYIFEEAAGILRFLQRKKEALRKLEQTELNVSRVKDIHQEVERQIIVLEEQAEKAKQFKEDKFALEKLEKILLLTKWNTARLRLSDLKERCKEQGLQIFSVKSQLDALQSRLMEAKKTRTEIENALSRRREEVFKARSKKEIQFKEKQSNQERVKELLAKEKRWKEEIESMVEKKLRRNEQRMAIEQIQKGLEKDFKEREKAAAEQRQKVKGLEEEISRLRALQQSKQKEAMKLLHSENQCESEIKQVNLRLENAREKQKQLEARKERLAQSIHDLSLSVEEKKGFLQESGLILEGQKGLFLGAEKDLQEVSEELIHAQSEIDILQQEMTDAKARQKALHRLREDMEGFSAGSKRLLQESANPKSPFYEKIKGLYEFFIPEKGVEAALAAVMKAYAQTLVIEKEADFKAVIAYVKQYKIKDVSLLCVESIGKIKVQKLAKSEGLSPLAAHLLENDLVKHFLQNAYLAKGQSPLELLEKGKEIELFAEDGAFIDRRSVVSYASQGENNVFLREAELKALEKKVRDAENEKQQRDAILRSLQQRRNQLQGERTELDKAIRRGEMKLIELNFALQKALADLEKNSSEGSLIDTECKSTAKTIESLSLVLGDLKEQYSKAKSVATDAQTHIEGVIEQLNAHSLNFKEQGEWLKEAEAALQRIATEQHQQAHALYVLDVKDVEADEHKKRLEDEIGIGRTLLGQIKLKENEADKILTEVEHALTDAEAMCTELEQQSAKNQQSVEHFEEKIQGKHQLLKKHEGEEQHLNFQCAQVESSMQAMEGELQERHHSALEEALHEAGPLEKSTEQTEKQIRALRQKLESAGDINMTSIEECEKHKTRYQFLNRQIDDLALSKQELIAIISQLDGESRKAFKETFNKISANFKKNFQILFNGGEAELQFTETADVLEAGIDIIAKPPGKQMRSINLLSGGEKCLTAMALLFAIFEVKPAPFCILDEIDAPLDDTNVERFVNIVKLFVDRCQFIIITHNKRTMAIADILVGVSMEEKGVSKLLSMNFKSSSAELISV